MGGPARTIPEPLLTDHPDRSLRPRAGLRRGTLLYATGYLAAAAEAFRLVLPGLPPAGLSPTTRRRTTSRT